MNYRHRERSEQARVSIWLYFHVSRASLRRFEDATRDQHVLGLSKLVFEVVMPDLLPQLAEILHAPFVRGTRWTVPIVRFTSRSTSVGRV